MKRIILAAFSFLVLILMQNQANAAAGDFDVSFGSGGKMVIGSSVNLKHPKAAVQSDGNKYVIVATLSSDTDFFVWMAKLNRNGSFDAAGTGGFSVVTDYLTDTDGTRLRTGARDVKILPSGKILVLSGATRRDGTVISAVTRYYANGRIDYTFGIGGRAIIPNILAEQMEVRTDGKIIVAGESVSSEDKYFFAARLLASGILDVSFNLDGIAEVRFLPRCAIIAGRFHGVKVQPDGKVILFGNVVPECTPRVGLARLLDNGSLDTSFDLDGIVIGVPRFEYGNSSVVIQSDKSVVVHFSEHTSLSTSAFLKFTESGQLSGMQYTSPRVSYMGRIAQQSDKKFVLAGSVTNLGRRYDFAVKRYTSDFLTDWSYSSYFVLTDFTSPFPAGVYAADIPTQILIDSFDTALIVGTTQQGTGLVKLALIRLLPS